MLYSHEQSVNKRKECLKTQDGTRPLTHKMHFGIILAPWFNNSLSALTRQTFVGKVMSLFYNMLSRSVIAFLPRSKCLLISWLQSYSAVILEPPKIKSLTVSIVSPSICHYEMGLDAMILVFECWILSQLFHSSLPFLNPALTSGSSWFSYCWSLAWRILGITLLACEMNAVVR